MLARTPQAAPRPPFAAPAARISEIRNPQSEMKRSAFTLVEMLVAIVIIAILIALLLPAISRSRISANEARVVVEIKQFETAIASFKARFGVEPPSRLVLFEQGADGTDGGNDDWDDYSYGPDVARSRAIIKRIWPQFNFATQHDFNANNTLDTGTNSVVLLNAGECLVFFLGGVRLPDVVPQVFPVNRSPIGFAKNPTNPFDPTSTTRDPPFFEFQAGRFVDTDNDRMLEYVDSIPGQAKPYLYLSSNEGRGYDLTDLGTSLGAMIDVYRTVNTTTTTAPFPAFRPQAFQIISPGYDQIYGAGGWYDPSDPVTSLASGRPTAVGDPNQYGKGEFDNLTNFNGGRLSP